MKKHLLIALCFWFTFISLNLEAQSPKEYPFMDPRLSSEVRATDLVGRLTLDEKIGQMMHAAPAIARLEIPEYNWWNECLHGVARAGLATVFPQAIGLGATWDQELMFRVATAISDEARAKHHEFVRRDKRYIYQGLTFWSPNINIFRDPRWGRGQETYGEDPYLTGRLAVQFIKGLQGDNPKYFKTIATVKHFAVHSGPEPLRHAFDAVVDERDFRETYLPQFEMGVKEGKAYSVMCAYNRFDDEACCGSTRLLTTILRNEWGFQGYVVSDCGAIGDIYQQHKIVPTPEEAAALAVKSGCDLECSTTYAHLTDAVKKGLISEQELDVSLRRLFVARIKLGMFDPPEMVSYTKIPYAVVDNKEHHELAREAARKSIVLLKNENNLLPLKKDIRTIAVIGPNSDESMMLLGNYNGTPSDPVTPLRGIREKLGSASRVLYEQGCELVHGNPTFTIVPSSVFFCGENEHGLKVDYFRSHTFTGGVLFSAIDKNLEANWRDKSPRADMDDDNFGVKWNGQLCPEQTGTYQVGVITTCKVDVYLNDSLIVDTKYHFRDEFGDPRLRKSVPLKLDAGKRYAIRVEAGETYGDAQVQLVWTMADHQIGERLKARALEAAKQADVIVMCMGLTARLEGEEMDVELDGFKGGDRTSLDLPRVQEELVKEISATGKPVVLVLLNGSALSVNWENAHIPAILEAWYPGQAAGEAIADVLFGDYNPGGRLPVTFYRSVDDLPPFDDYKVTGHTYRYFKGETLWPFGFGLSYTKFQYSNMLVTSNVKIGDTVKVLVDVKNSGALAGDEVVQLYLSNTTAAVPVPLRALKGFRRIRLSPGESKTIEFSILPNDFSVIDEKNQRKIFPGQFLVSIGGGQPGMKGAHVLSANLSIE